MGFALPGVFAGLLALSVVVYWGLWRNLWYQDDWRWLQIAREIARSPSFLFTPDAHNSEAVLRVTQRVVLGLTYGFARLDARAYHAVSILLQAMAATAVFRLLLVLLRRFSPQTPPWPWALLGAVVYAASSNHSMAVLWMSAQSTLLATTAAAAMLTVWIESEGRLGQRATWLWVGGLFLLTLVSKNTAATLPLAGAAYLALRPTRASRRDWMLAGALTVLAAVHLALTKFLLPLAWGQDVAITDQGQFALSIVTARNLVGAVLGGFVSARTYGTLGMTVPFELLGVGLTSLLLLFAFWLRVLRPVTLGLIWIVALVLPTACLDYVQYDPTQLTANRYQHLPLVGAVVVTVFLAQATWHRLGHRLGHRRTTAAVIVALTLLHVAFHRWMLQGDLGLLRTWGDTEMSFIDHTLARAESTMPKGTTIYAVHWKTGDAYLASVEALYFTERGYRFAGEQAYVDFQAHPRVDPTHPPWVAAYDPVGKQFGVMPLARYLQLPEYRGGRSP